MDYVINLFQIMIRKTCHKKKYPCTGQRIELKTIICHMKVSVLNRRKRYPLMKILDELDYGLNLSYG